VQRRGSDDAAALEKLLSAGGYEVVESRLPQMSLEDYFMKVVQDDAKP